MADVSIAALDVAVNNSRAKLAKCTTADDNWWLKFEIARSLTKRYRVTKHIDDLNEAIQLYTWLKSGPHHDIDCIWNNLATLMHDRYLESGDSMDLDQAIVCYKKALHFRSIGHPNRGTSLNNLAWAVHDQYIQSKSLADLDQAIDLHEQALKLHPPGHIGHSNSLENLALVMNKRYRQSHNKADLNQAIVLYKQALRLCPLGHSNHIMLLSNLAAAMRDKYHQGGNIDDLDQAINLHEQAVPLRVLGCHEHRMSLNNLAFAMHDRYLHNGNRTDFDYIITLHVQGFQLCPFSCSDQDASSGNCTMTMHYHDERSNSNQTSEVCHCFLQINSKDFKCSALEKLVLANSQAYYARSTNDSTMLKAYQTALTALRVVLIDIPMLSAQEVILKRYDYLGVDAVSCAAQVGQNELALEFLEQGRALLWSQVNHFKVHAATSIKDFHNHAESVSEEKAMSEQRNQLLIKQIKFQPGYKSFMKSLPFNTLRNVAAEGPVIVVNCSVWQSHVIILHAEKISTIPLGTEFYEVMKRSSENLLECRKHIETEPERYDHMLEEIMVNVWHNLVGPIVKKLQELGVKKHTRVWWCPTSFVANIPLHAAGPIPNEEKKKYFCDLYVSSFALTLSALIESRSKVVETNEIPTMLVVAQPDPFLHGAAAEMQILEEVSNIKLIRIDGDNAPAQEVIKELEIHPWVHFACHAELIDNKPFNAAFVLNRDERITLSDIIMARMPHAQFAFLSACQTAQLTDGGASEEILHLAAAMHFGGFSSVVGTMWQMNDADGPDLVREFYKQMLMAPTENAPEVGLRRGARALNTATRALKDKVGMRRWANFVHIGL